MNRRDLLAYGLIGLGVVALLAQLTDGAGWLWIALVAAALIAAYVSQRTYGFLLIGALLAGTALGILLQQLFPRFDGVFLIALGGGLFAVDVVEPREPFWARRLGAVLAALGLLSALATSGVLGSAWFALLLIAVGVLLVWRRQRAGSFPPPLVTPPGEPLATTRPSVAPPAEPDATSEDTLAPEDGDDPHRPPPDAG